MFHCLIPKFCSVHIHPFLKRPPWHKLVIKVNKIYGVFWSQRKRPTTFCLLTAFIDYIFLQTALTVWGKRCVISSECCANWENSLLEQISISLSWKPSAALTKMWVIIAARLRNVVATDAIHIPGATQPVNYSIYRGNTTYGPPGLGQYLISSYLWPLTHAVRSSQLFTGRALSPTESWGQLGYLQFLWGQGSSLAPVMESSPARRRSRRRTSEPITKSRLRPVGLRLIWSPSVFGSSKWDEAARVVMSWLKWREEALLGLCRMYCWVIAVMKT